MLMWLIEKTGLFQRRFKKYEKKHRDALVATLNNLDSFQGALNCGVKPEQIQAGFIHREPKGVVAIDQTGASQKQRETRLYVYAHVRNETLYLITIGDKTSQKKDIDDCKKFVEELRKVDQDG